MNHDQILINYYHANSYKYMPTMHIVNITYKWISDILTVVSILLYYIIY
jgi:hypothetical protein